MNLEQIEWFDPLERKGNLTQSKIHAKANRPHKIISNITKEVSFCKCCLLPLPKKNIVVPFAFCDSIEKYSQLGLGTYLYFYFIIFAFVIAATLLAVFSFSEIYISQSAVKELTKFCSRNNNSEILTCGNYKNLSSPSFDITNDLWIYQYNYNSLSHYRMLFRLLYNEDSIDDCLPNVVLLSIGGVALLIVFNVLFIILVNVKIHQVNGKIRTPSLFTAFVSNINAILDKYYKEEESDNDSYVNFITSEILEIEEEDNVKVITMSYQLNKFYALIEEIKGIKVKLYRIENIQSQIEYNRRHCYREDLNTLRYRERKCFCCYKIYRKSDLIERMRTLEKEISEKRNKLKENFAGCLFLSFSSVRDRDKFLSKHSCSYCSSFLYLLRFIFFSCCGKCLPPKMKFRQEVKVKLKISSAPEPDDVIWENLEISQQKQFLLSIKTFLLSLLMIITSLILVCGLNYLQDKVANEYKEKIKKSQEKKNILMFLSYLISFAISIVIAIINSIIQLILEKLTIKEKAHTKTQRYLSYSIKLTLLTFCNSALVPYVAYLIWRASTIDVLSKNIFMIFLTNSFLPIVWLFNPKYIFAFLTRKIFCIERSENENKYNQRELNKFFEHPPMNISIKYSYFAMSIIMDFFYISIFPLGILFTVLGTFFAFLIEKWNIAHLYNKPEMINEKICVFYINYFKFALIPFAVGNFIFIDDYYHSKYWTMIFILFLLAILLFPFGKILNVRACMKRNHIANLNYDDEYLKFNNDYQRENPITKKEGVVFYLSKLKEKNLITEKEYHRSLVNMNDINLMEMYYKGHSKTATNNKSRYDIDSEIRILNNN